MLLTITTTYRPATDLGYLLHKHPARCQDFELSFGNAHVFFPEAGEERCTAALVLDADPIGMVRGRSASRGGGILDQYVNDRPYVASSFLSVAIAQIFGTALHGRCRDRAELVGKAIPLKAGISMLPCRGGEGFLHGLFEPLGYTVSARRHPLDPAFPEWGSSPYYTVELEKTATVASLLSHLYVLIPVLDNYKHYYIGDDEVEKLMSAGEGWLSSHPLKEAITRRYLKFQPGLARQALMRLSEEESLLESALDEKGETHEESLEKRINLNEERLQAVFRELKASGAHRVLDMGCGEGKLLQLLIREKQFFEIVGMDVSICALERAHERLNLEMLPQKLKERIKILHGSLMYRDRRLEGYDAAAAVEVIEHLDLPRLRAFERVLFEYARPGTAIVTTPNSEYNTLIKELEPGRMRHNDHRFEWKRCEFRQWAERIAAQYGYNVTFQPIGKADESLGSPTQMAIFARNDNRIRGNESSVEKDSRQQETGQETGQQETGQEETEQ
ncbi:MAG: 3' terminal RNA ribose 2'-O-methyltransferase Hen1 [Candidatus Xenobiia bacterium LiM19]